MKKDWKQGKHTGNGTDIGTDIGTLKVPRQQFGFNSLRYKHQSSSAYIPTQVESHDFEREGIKKGQCILAFCVFQAYCQNNG